MSKSKTKENFVVYCYLREKEDRFGRYGTIYYVGKGRPNRPYQCYKYSRTVKCPRDRENNIVILHKNLKEETAFDYEKKLIELYGRIDTTEFGVLRNLTDGGEGPTGILITEEKRKKLSGEKNGMYGKKHTAEARKIMSEKSRAYVNSPGAREQMSIRAREAMSSPEVRQKISEGVLRSITDERRKRMSESRKGKKRSPESIRKSAESNTGKKRTQETKDKISASNKGKKRSEEVKRRKSEQMKGRKASEETRRKMSEAHSGKNHHMYGKKHSEESKRKMSESRKGKKANLTEEGRKKLSEKYSGSNNPMHGKYGAQHNRGIPRNWVHPVHGEHRGLTISDLVRKFPEEKLNPGTLSLVARGKNSHHKGWKILKDDI